MKLAVFNLVLLAVNSVAVGLIYSYGHMYHSMFRWNVVLQSKIKECETGVSYLNKRYGDYEKDVKELLKKKKSK